MYVGTEDLDQRLSDCICPQAKILNDTCHTIQMLQVP
jgi:hypothetical protein